jgi:multidrug efflux system membrane fusion protein
MRTVLLLAGGLVLAAIPCRADDPPKKADAGLPFSGVVEADTVEIRARVNGYITKIAGKDGATVKKGEVLAEIDSRPYRIELDKAKAQLARAEAQARVADAKLERLAELVKKGIVPKEELDQAAAEREAAKADVEACKAGLASAEVQLAYTRLVSPIDGRLGQFRTTEGNLVRADETSLVTVVRTDPLYIAFDVPERDFLRLRDTLKDNKAAVAVGFSNDEGYPHKVTVDFVAPTFDVEKGTVRVRAKLPNPKGDYVPGMFARVRITPAK